MCHGSGIPVAYAMPVTYSYPVIQIMPRRMNFDYVIIHGRGLAGGERLTKLLSNRADKAIEVYDKCQRKPVIIPNGGLGDDEKVSEAQAMKTTCLSTAFPNRASCWMISRPRRERTSLTRRRLSTRERAGRRRRWCRVTTTCIGVCESRVKLALRVRELVPTLRCTTGRPRSFVSL